MTGLPEKRKILFIHIPKTAGLSINAEFRRVYGARAIVTNGFFPLQHELKTTALADLDYIGGHVTYPQYRTVLAQEPSQHFCLSLIREPLRRAISHYLFILRTDNAPMAKIRAPFLGKSFEYFVDFAAEYMPDLVVNTQCTYLCGEGDATAAMAAIETYSVVASTPRFQDLYDRLRRETGDRIAPWSADRRRNVAPPASSDAEVQQGHMPEQIAALAPPHVVRKLERIAAEDFALYEAFETRHQGFFCADADVGAG